MISYGLDPALKRGVLVEAEWDFSDPKEVKLLGYKVLVDWTQPLGEKVSLRELCGLADEVIEAVKYSNGRQDAPKMGIDWDINSVFWGKRVNGAKLAYLMGYLMKGLQDLMVVPVYISPSQVRKAFGKKSQASKEDVQRESIVALPEDEESGDVKDALLLSYLVVASSMKRIDLKEQKERHPRY